MPSRSQIDISFTVPFTHRLRFTRDALGEDRQVLADLLEPSGSEPARVQFWLDEHVAEAQPDLKTRIRRFVKSQSHLTMPGNIQVVPGGEAVKNDVHIVERMLKCINAVDLDRRSYVVVIGGGAVLDAVGFAAAIAHRGIRLVRLPTTTLAQADSGVGVKNSVNLFQKKNWIGTFAVPWGVVNDARLLSTLSDRDYRCGFSEAVKVTALKDRGAFEEIEQLADRIRERDMEAAHRVIAHSAKLHLEHITLGGDPFEALEARPLDFGHWSAHKMEVMSEFGLRHGEAVAIGVAVDTVYSSLQHRLDQNDAERIVHCLLRLGLELDHPCLHQTQTLFSGLEEFRQHLGGRLTLTMLSAIGSKLDVHEIDREAMLEAIDIVAKIGKSTGAASKPRLSRSGRRSSGS
jgi:3-dehydroquinate synthase